VSDSTRNHECRGASLDTDLEILKLLYTEWENRQNRFWSIYSKSTTFIFIVILLPAISEKLGFDLGKVSTLPPHFLSVFGIVFAFISMLMARAETLRVIQLKDCIKENANLLSGNFTKAYSNSNSFNAYIPAVVFIVQTLSAVVMIVSLA